MPGPGQRAKVKAKKPKTPTTPQTANGSQAHSAGEVADGIYIAEIDNAEGWDLIVTILCDYFKLPDLTRRSGLKKVHANFETYYKRINDVYEKSEGNDKIRGAIIGIFAKMCVDSLLRNKLFDKGVVDKIMPLLRVDETRHLAMRALSTITHHGGAKVRIEIAKNSNAIATLLRDLPDDEKLADIGIAVLAHSISSVTEGEERPAHPRELAMIDMPLVLQTALAAVRRPHSHPLHMIDHAIELITTTSMHAASAFKAYPQAIAFMVAGMRSRDWATRSSCLGGLLRLYALEAEDDQRGLDPNRLISALQHGVPDKLADICIDYGQQQCEMYLTLRCTSEFQRAMMDCLRTHDMYALGLTQARLILQTEFAIADGMFQFENPKTGKLEFDDGGLPFRMWSDSLPHCARAIRTKGVPKEADLADIIDIKYAIMKQRVPEAVRLSQAALTRSPQQAYFYYAMTLSADSALGLRAAKKGLKCKITTPFVKYQLMQRAVLHAGEMGLRMLQGAHASDADRERRWEEGIAFMMSALDDAKAYIAGAPPDNRHMKNVGYWYVLLTILLEDQLSADLKELKKPLERLDIADQFSEFMGVTPPRTSLRLAEKAAVKYYASGVRDFGGVFATLDKYKAEAQPAPEIRPGQVEDDLASWLENMNMEDGSPEFMPRCGGAERPMVNYDNLTLYRCSWCANPSAALRKCSGCAKTRYCDSGCQKAHWNDHKKACKAAA